MPGYPNRSQVPPRSSRRSRITYFLVGHSFCRCHAALIPEIPAPTITTSTNSVMGQKLSTACRVVNRSSNIRRAVKSVIVTTASQRISTRGAAAGVPRGRRATSGTGHSRHRRETVGEPGLADISSTIWLKGAGLSRPAFYFYFPQGCGAAATVRARRRGGRRHGAEARTICPARQVRPGGAGIRAFMVSFRTHRAVTLAAMASPRPAPSFASCGRRSCAKRVARVAEIIEMERARRGPGDDRRGGPVGVAEPDERTRDGRVPVRGAARHAGGGLARRARAHLGDVDLAVSCLIAPPGCRCRRLASGRTLPRRSGGGMDVSAAARSCTPTSTPSTRPSNNGTIRHCAAGRASSAPGWCSPPVTKPRRTACVPRWAEAPGHGAIVPERGRVPPRMTAYSRASAAIFAVFRDIHAAGQPLSVDEAFLDVSGLRRTANEPVAIAARLRAQVRDRGSACRSPWASPAPVPGQGRQPGGQAGRAAAAPRRRRIAVPASAAGAAALWAWAPAPRRNCAPTASTP